MDESGNLTMSFNSTQDSGIASIRNTLIGWLDGSASVAMLYHLLQGDGWPAVGVEDEPYTLFIAATEGLPVYRTRLIERLAQALDSKPDVTTAATRPAQMLYNLLRLCAEVYSPEVLGPPLRGMWARRQLRDEWRGADLRDRLRAALILNQPDREMLPDWEAMLNGHTDEFLGGSWQDGFLGLLAIKPPNGVDPDFSILGRALHSVADHLKHTGPARNIRLRRFLERLQRAYPDRNWATELIVLGDKYQWPGWGITALPTVVGLQNGSAYVLSSVAKGLEAGYGIETEQQMWSGLMSKVRLGDHPSARDFLRQFQAIMWGASNDMKTLGIQPWVHAVKDSFVYLARQNEEGDNAVKQAIRIANDSFRQIEVPLLAKAP